MERIYKFLIEAETYYLATVEEDQPRVRPFGTIALYEGKLYIQTGKKKAVSRQMQANPKVELCAMKGQEWVRIQAEAVRDDRLEPKKHMLDCFPALATMYDPMDGNMEMLYLKHAVATIYSLVGEPVTVTFG